MDKVDYKKQFKDLYLPKKQPALITVPPLRFAMLNGQGDPNGETFAEVVAALYSFSYAVKMSYKSKVIPDGYYDYTVFPLEGVWDLVDKTKTSADKSNYAYTMMIRQPDFVTDELAERILTGQVVDLLHTLLRLELPYHLSRSVVIQRLIEIDCNLR